eukprot:7171333-Prymnesium_polylepis.1
MLLPADVRVWVGIPGVRETRVCVTRCSYNGGRKRRTPHRHAPRSRPGSRNAGHVTSLRSTEFGG